MTTTTTMTAATTTTTATTMTSTATVTAFEGFHNFVGPLLQMTKIAQTIFNLHDGLNCSVMIGTSQNRRKAREEKKIIFLSVALKEGIQFFFSKGGYNHNYE